MWKKLHFLLIFILQHIKQNIYELFSSCLFSLCLSWAAWRVFFCLIRKRMFLTTAGFCSLHQLLCLIDVAFRGRTKHEEHEHDEKNQNPYSLPVFRSMAKPFLRRNSQSAMQRTCKICRFAPTTTKSLGAFQFRQRRMHCKMNVKTKDHAQKDKINAKWFRAYRTSIRGRAKVKSITNTYRDREYGLQSGFCLWPTSCVQKKFEKWQMAFHYIIVCSRKTNRMNETESSRLFGFFLIWLIIWDRKNECWCELHRLVGRKKTFPTLNQINGRISTGEYGTLGTCTKEHTILDGKTGAKKKKAHTWQTHMQLIEQLCSFLIFLRFFFFVDASVWVSSSLIFLVHVSISHKHEELLRATHVHRTEHNE